MNKKEERIQKLLSQAGIASRRKAEELVKDGKVLINGDIAQLGQKATFEDQIIVEGKNIQKQNYVYYLLHKPVKTLSASSDGHNKKVVVDLIDDSSYLFPVGRLDFDTTGAIIITNDGELTNRLLHPSHEIEKVYKARLDAELTKAELELLNSWKVVIDHKPSKQIVRKIGDKIYEVTLKEGRNHHVKKLFNFINREVVQLHRKKFAGITANELKIGTYRPLTDKEIAYLYSLSEK